MIIINQKVAIALSLCIVAVFTSSCCNNIFLFYPNYDGDKNSVAYAQQSSSRNGQTVTFITDDGVSIVGTYYAPSSGLKDSTPTIILLHMLGKDRSTWNTFASALSHKGYAVLSIDLRGHGESIKQGSSTASYQSFTANDFQTLCAKINCGENLKIYSGSNSHGTNMFSESLNPPLQDLIMSWLSSSLPP